jgi:hypothetical protein
MYERADYRKFDDRKSSSAFTVHLAAKRDAGLPITRTFHVSPCFNSQHVSKPFVFYLSKCFRFLHIFSTCFRSLHILSLLHVSCPFMFYISDPSILYRCMLQIPSCVMFRHVAHPSIFQLSACFTSSQVLGDWRVPSRPVLRCSRFDALLQMCVNNSAILDVTTSSCVERYQRFGRSALRSP